VDPVGAGHAVEEDQAAVREEHGVAETNGYAQNGKEAPLMDQEKDTEDRATQDSGEPVNNANEEAADTKATAAKTGSSGILPTKAAEDDPRRWGDDSGYDHEQWLKEQKPPHWG